MGILESTIRGSYLQIIQLNRTVKMNCAVLSATDFSFSVRHESNPLITLGVSVFQRTFTHFSSPSAFVDIMMNSLKTNAATEGSKATFIQGISKIALVVVATLGIAACSSDDPVTTSGLPTFSAPEVTTRDSGMVVSVRETSDVTIHTLTAPESVFANSTHLIETANSLVAIDTQFLLPNAQDMRAYADTLGKPIDRVYITHEHPDHFLGSEAFNDRPVFALQAVSDLIAQNGDAEIAEKQGDFGPANIASTFVVPDIAVPGTVMIDGISFLLEEVLDAEAQTQLVVKLPDHGVVATGDIVYSGVHLILAGQTDTWTTALQNLASSSAEYPIVLAGHGVAAAPSVYDTNISWLAKARELIDSVDNFDDFKQGLVDAFPDLGMDAAIDFVQAILFP